MTFRIRVTTGGPTPIYQQIVEQVRLAVSTGALAPGQRIPSVREQAERLVLNANTVAKAYGELVAEGVLRSERGRGLFVADAPARGRRDERLRRIGPAIDALARAAAGFGLEPGEVGELVAKRMAALRRDAGEGAKRPRVRRRRARTEANDG